MAVKPYFVWVNGELTTAPVELYDTVQVKAWGGDVTLADVGTTGVVTKINRTRVVITSGKSTLACSPDQLTLLSRQADRWCPVCEAQPGEKCGSTVRGRRFDLVLMHRIR